MDSYLTLIGSILIGGLLMMNVQRFQADVKEHTYEQTYKLIMQSRAQNIIDQVEWDFRQIGFGSPYDALTIYGTDKITYNVDLGNDGIIDSVHYQLSDVNAAASTSNPNDRILYRWSNQDPIINGPLGVTDFSLVYYDKDGNETANKQEIKSIKVSLDFENTEPIDGKYFGYHWSETITPLNLQSKLN